MAFVYMCKFFVDRPREIINLCNWLLIERPEQYGHDMRGPVLAFHNGLCT